MRKTLLVLLLVIAAGAFGWATETVAGPNFHCNQVNVHPNSLQNGQTSVAYSDTLWLTPANPALQVFVTSVTGSLPPGLFFVSGPNINQVTLTGTPTTPGVYTFTVEIGGTYVLGTICKVMQTYTITIL